MKEIETDRPIPESIRIIGSGWTGNYHVIYECPEDGDSSFSHYFGKKEQITKDLANDHGFKEDELRKLLWEEE